MYLIGKWFMGVGLILVLRLSVDILVLVDFDVMVNVVFDMFVDCNVDKFVKEIMVEMEIMIWFGRFGYV